MTDNKAFHSEEVVSKQPKSKQDSYNVSYTRSSGQVQILEAPPTPSPPLTLVTSIPSPLQQQILVRHGGPCLECAQRQAMMMQRRKQDKVCGCCVCIDNPFVPKQVRLSSNEDPVLTNIILCGVGCICCPCWSLICVMMNLYFCIRGSQEDTALTCGSCGKTITGQ